MRGIGGFLSGTAESPARLRKISAAMNPRFQHRGLATFAMVYSHVGSLAKALDLKAPLADFITSIRVVIWYGSVGAFRDYATRKPPIRFTRHLLKPLGLGTRLL